MAGLDEPNTGCPDKFDEVLPPAEFVENAGADNELNTNGEPPEPETPNASPVDE